MAGENFYAGQYEFQCLHGMGEPLYEEVVGPGKLDRPCRIYAPVGTHETLLAYLVRRLLENGANTSFVNQIADPDVTIEELLADPVERARALEPVGAPHPRSSCRTTCSAATAGIRAASTLRTSRCWPVSPRPWQEARAFEAIPCLPTVRAPARCAQSPILPIAATSSAQSWRRRPTSSTRPASWPAHGANRRRHAPRRFGGLPT